MIYVVYVWFYAIIGIIWGITKQIVTDIIGEYLKLCPLSWEYSPWLSASGNIPNFGEIILNIHLIVSNYLYIIDRWTVNIFAGQYWVYIGWSILNAFSGKQRIYSRVNIEYILAGEADEECVHESVPFRDFLRVCEAEGTGEPQHHLDCRVRLTETSC